MHPLNANTPNLWQTVFFVPGDGNLEIFSITHAYNDTSNKMENGHFQMKLFHTKSISDRADMSNM